MRKTEVIEILLSGQMPDRKVLLDDGLYYIQHNADDPLHKGGGRLKKYCRPSRQFPEGVEVIGDYALKPDGLWVIGISANYIGPEQSDREVLGAYPHWLEAVAELWLARFMAHCQSN